MATQSPFPFLDGFFAKFGSNLRAPQWLVDEVQHRAVLFLNHVLMQEKEATDRLARQKGKSVHVAWRGFSMKVMVTPAGLLERTDATAEPDLRIQVMDESPLALARHALQGEKPAIRIEGDVQLAAEINWLADNVRWDVEEDLARLVGDVPAHLAADVARRVSDAMRGFVGGRTRGAGTTGKAAP
jgi:ubiquinone biosynthesis accessory factor UbiJ